MVAENRQLKPEWLDAIKALQAKHIPLIGFGKETLAELSRAIELLNLNFPMIVEDGSAIMIPHGTFDSIVWQKSGGWHEETDDHRIIILGKKAAAVRYAIHEIRDALRLEVETFEEMNLGEICIRAGMDPEAALFASDRYFSEVVWFEDLTHPRFRDFLAALHVLGIKAVEENGLMSLLGAGSDNQAAMDMLSQMYVWKEGAVDVKVFRDGPDLNGYLLPEEGV